MDDNEIQLGEVLFEFVPQGNFVKVIAVDPITRVEVSIVGDRRASTRTLEDIAIKKLIYVLQKNKAAETSNSDDNLY